MNTCCKYVDHVDHICRSDASHELVPFAGPRLAKYQSEYEPIPLLTILLVVANFANTKICKKLKND